jgi:hypothetical protein
MDPERLNLSALDPAADAEHWERVIKTITGRALPELTRRAAVRSPLLLLAGWARPMLSAAALLAAISITALTTVHRAPQSTEPQAAGLVEELRVPAPLATWLTEERAPTIDDLILALNGESR